MSTQDAIDIAQKAMITGFLVSAPVLVTALAVGVVSSFFQTLTQIQDSTLTLVPKLVAVGLVLLLALPWMLDVLIRFTASMYDVMLQGSFL